MWEQITCRKNDSPQSMSIHIMSHITDATLQVLAGTFNLGSLFFSGLAH